MWTKILKKKQRQKENLLNCVQKIFKKKKTSEKNLEKKVTLKKIVLLCTKIIWGKNSDKNLNLGKELTLNIKTNKLLLFVYKNCLTN